MKFSIIIPSLNQGEFIERTLQSVLTQESVDLEIFVVDGGSSDQTLGILEKFGSRVSWVSEKDGGQADAINRGLACANGDILAYLNSDDVYFEGALKRVHDHFLANSESKIVYGNGEHIDVHDGFVESYPTEAWDYERLGEVCFICQPTTFWRREVVERFGVFDDRLNFAMDYDYWLRVGRELEFHYIEGSSLAGSRMYGTNKTMGQRYEAHREILKVTLNHCRKPPYRWLKALAHVSIEEQMGDRCPPGTAEFSLEFVERTLRFADEFGILLSLDECEELEGHLRGGRL
ncbi:MAG: glycosyltransferase family 2 protein [Verrucomicrobiales bacterium]|nr:glycosyltransferase family 2 protein [Verrucomicrobiales bacterium]